MGLVDVDVLRPLLTSLARAAAFLWVGHKLAGDSAPRWRAAVAGAAVFAILAARQFFPQDYLFSVLNQFVRAALCAAMFWWAYRAKGSYALFLGFSFAELLGLWRGASFVVLPQLYFRLTGTELPLGVAGCEVLSSALGILSVFVVYGRLVEVDPAREMRPMELFMSLFPSYVCYLTILSLHYRDFVVYEGGGEFSSAMTILIALNTAAAVLVLIASERYFQARQREELLDAAQRQIDEQHRMFLRYRDSQEDLRILHHDLRNHLSLIRGLSEEEGKQYLDGLMGQVRDELTEVDTGNATLNVLIGQKRKACREEGIELRPYVNFSDGGFLTQAEICALFGNAIDNAREALQTHGQQNPVIRITGGTIANFLVVRVENPVPKSMQIGGVLPETSKDDPAHHGLGLRSIRKIVEARGGAMSVSAEDGTFTLKWMIPVEAPKG